jgi:hypothetical protein
MEQFVDVLKCLDRISQIEFQKPITVQGLKRKVAGFLGLSEQNLQNYISGKRSPKGIINAITQKYTTETDVNWILWGVRQKNPETKSLSTNESHTLTISIPISEYRDLVQEAGEARLLKEEYKKALDVIYKIKGL